MSAPTFPLNLVPTLKTERLLLRGYRPEDFTECAKMWADPLVTRFIGGKPNTEQETWNRFLRSIGHWALLGFGLWVAEEKSSGAYVGAVGFSEFKRLMVPSHYGVPEAGWTFASHSHGKGYATEALKAVLNWGSVHFGPIRTVCIIAPENTSSRRVAEKCGFKEVLATTYEGRPTILYERHFDAAEPLA